MPTSCWKIWKYLPSLANIILLLPSANVVWDGYVFTPVCHSVHRGSLPQNMLGYTPPSRQTPRRWTPPWADTPSLPSTCWDTHTPFPVHAGIHSTQCMLGQTWLLLRMVCILLECILVLLLLPSATKLQRLCFYTCLSFCPWGGGVLSQHALQMISEPALQQGGSAPWGVPGPGGGVCSRGGVPGLRGCLLWGVCSGGACSRGSAPCGGGRVWRPPPKADGYCCRRYASYWNAFLF